MKTQAKSLLILVFILIQIVGACYAVVQGEHNKRAQLNHIKVMENYYNLLDTN